MVLPLLAGLFAGGSAWGTAATVATAASGLIGAASSIRAGQQAALTSQQQAKQMEIDRKLNEVNALQLQRARVDQYYDAKAANDALFSFQMGGGENLSQAAFERKQKRTMVEDVARSQLQSGMESSKRTVEQMIEIQRGQNARSVGMINAISTLANTAYSIYQIK